eukprot:TRINITY_DN9865_c1_g3_i1.p1 TRINITY_DN9865_c1_g3~~TRINITY_DN9865_c1_g3_i1.p1  ORF type:complete len:504 (-),score=88.66 TRINITY_DN9865_c1_g3_i1:124-1635(-)
MSGQTLMRADGASSSSRCRSSRWCRLDALARRHRSSSLVVGAAGAVQRAPVIQKSGVMRLLLAPFTLLCRLARLVVRHLPDEARRVLSSLPGALAAAGWTLFALAWLSYAGAVVCAAFFGSSSEEEMRLLFGSLSRSLLTHARLAMLGDWADVAAPLALSPGVGSFVWRWYVVFFACCARLVLISVLVAAVYRTVSTGGKLYDDKMHLKRAGAALSSLPVLESLGADLSVSCDARLRQVASGALHERLTMRDAVQIAGRTLLRQKTASSAACARLRHDMKDLHPPLAVPSIPVTDAAAESRPAPYPSTPPSPTSSPSTPPSEGSEVELRRRLEPRLVLEGGCSFKVKVSDPWAAAACASAELQQVLAQLEAGVFSSLSHLRSEEAAAAVSGPDVDAAEASDCGAATSLVHAGPALVSAVLERASVSCELVRCQSVNEAATTDSVEGDGGKACDEQAGVTCVGASSAVDENAAVAEHSPDSDGLQGLSDEDEDDDMEAPLPGLT